MCLLILFSVKIHAYLMIGTYNYQKYLFASTFKGHFLCRNLIYKQAYMG